MGPFGKFLEKLSSRGLEYFGKFYSKYPAQVMGNEDKEGQQALFLHIPVIHHRGANTRVLPMGQFSGKGYGMQAIPRVGDLVTVEFLYGDPKFPRWSHGWYGKNELPKEFANKDIYGFVTPGKSSVTIDDKQGIITVTHVSGHTIVINKDQINIQVKDGEFIEVKKDVVELNGNTLGGLVKVQELITQLTALQTQISTMGAATAAAITVYSSILDSGSSASVFASTIASMTPVNTTQLENQKVKHG